MSTRRVRRRQRGQAMVETGIVILLLFMLITGTIEFGRAWMISNMITNAARTGARMAAVTTSRGGGGLITNTSAIQTEVLSEIQNVVATTGFTVTVAQPTIGGIPMAQVTVNATVPYLFNFLAPNFTVNRTVTFRDEGR